MKSIIQSEKACYICGTTIGLHEHHCIHGIANRKLADKYGLTVWLCRKHHEQVHADAEVDGYFKRLAQSKFEQTHSRCAFMAVFGRNYLGEGDYTTEANKREIDPIERNTEA